MNDHLPYQGKTILLTTKHSKSDAIAPSFHKNLGAFVLEYLFDTDSLGTFSGEIKREGNILECAKRKCEIAVDDNKAFFALASEGSFGPHPSIPFIPCNHEVLYFIDTTLNLHIYVSKLTTNTNYASKTIENLEDLKEFADKAGFPSHALILRPNHKDENKIIYKGIACYFELERRFKECLDSSNEGRVYVETDMRAHKNPTRMHFIGELAEELSLKLSTPCPKCKKPGWGIHDSERGLPCHYCGSATDLIKSEILSCHLCNHKEKSAPSHGLKFAEQQFCYNCNP